MECMQRKALEWRGTRNQRFKEILGEPLDSGQPHTEPAASGGKQASSGWGCLSKDISEGIFGVPEGWTWYLQAPSTLRSQGRRSHKKRVCERKDLRQPSCLQPGGGQSPGLGGKGPEFWFHSVLSM